MVEDVIVKKKKGVVEIILSNAKGNSLNFNLCKKIELEFIKIRNNKKIKAVVLSGKGKNFCTGADLNWLWHCAQMEKRAAKKQIKQLVNMYKAILKIQCPLLCVGQGKILGGGVGLLFCGDFVILNKNSVLALKEKHWGLGPGTIEPILKKRLGGALYKKAAVSGKKISLKKIEKMGLIRVAERTGQILDLKDKTIKSVQNKKIKRNKIFKKIKTKELAAGSKLTYQGIRGRVFKKKAAQFCSLRE